MSPKKSLKLKTNKEKSRLKSQEISKYKHTGIFDSKEHGLRVEIVGDVTPIEVNGQSGIQVFARAWKNGKQLGFGADGSVEIERFRIFNPPILVPDTNGMITRIGKDTITGITTTSRFRKDPVEAIRQTLAHTISVTAKNGENIIFGKIGKTTDTFYPNAGETTAPIDGRMTRELVNEAFSTLRNGAGNNHDNTEVTMATIGVVSSATLNQFRDIHRGGFGFNTSTIPDGATINSATFSLYVTATINQLGNTDADLVSFTPASESAFANADFAIANFGSTRLATGLPIESMTTGAYNDWTLNASGLTHISKIANTFFGSLVKWDLDNSFGGTWVSLHIKRFSCSTADETGTTQDPKLVVTYTVAANNGAPSGSLALMGCGM